MIINRRSRGVVGFVGLLTACFLLLTAARGLAGPQGMMSADERLIRQLNDQYVESFLKADVAWYQKHLADDFLCIESSGAIVNKEERITGFSQKNENSLL